MKNKNIILGASAALLIIGGIIWYRSRKPKGEEATPSDTPPVEEKPKSETTKSETTDTKTDSGQSGIKLDWTKSISNDSPLSVTNPNKENKKYNLGQQVTVKKGENISRLDKKGEYQGLTKTDNAKQLGYIWHINKDGLNVVIKSKSGFAYPFYIAKIDSLQ